MPRSSGRVSITNTCATMTRCVTRPRVTTLCVNPILLCVTTYCMTLHSARDYPQGGRDTRRA
eukprot:scaffold259443_cov21-Tisochrysis_lutea.AAC.1